MDALKFQLVHHDSFHSGQVQQDSTECLLMLIDIINNGSMPDSSSTTYPTGASLSGILVFFEKYIVCDVCGLRSPSFESNSVLHITPSDTSSMQDLILQRMQQKCKTLVLDVKRTLGTSNKTVYYNPQNICFSSLITLDTLTIVSQKIDAPDLWIRPLCLVPLNLAHGLL